MKITEVMRIARKRRKQAWRWRKKGMTYQEIGNRLGVGRARARMLVVTAIRYCECDAIH
jgi:hypothetical protein